MQQLMFSPCSKPIRLAHAFHGGCREVMGFGRRTASILMGSELIVKNAYIHSCLRS
jgi:uncharacterized protein YjlB